MTDPHPPACGAQDVPDDEPLSAERVAEIGKALGHPVRVRIVEHFRLHRPQMAQDIVEEFELAQSTISEHLRILRDAGVLIPTTDGPRTWHCLRRNLLRQYAAALVDLADDSVRIELG